MDNFPRGKIVVFALVGLSVLLVSCVTIKFKYLNSWTEPKVENESGFFIFDEPAKIGFFLSNSGTPIVRAQLSSNSSSTSILVAVDTGSPGSYIDKRLLDDFLDVRKTDFEFSAYLANGSNLSGSGYIFQELDFGGVVIKSPLFSAVDMTEISISSEKGEMVQCVLGMNILKKTSFLFSNTDKKIIFQDELVDELFSEMTLLEDHLKNGWETNRLKVVLPSYGSKYPFIIDTGADNLFFSPEFISQEIDANTKIARIRKGLQKIEEGLFTEFKIIPDKNSIVPYVQNIRSDNTLGFSVLRTYDFFIDYQRKILKIKSVEQIGSYDPYDLLVIPGSGLSPTFGFTLREKGKRRFIGELFYDLKMVPYTQGLKVNDELMCINGITLDMFDWKKWYELNEADFTFRRNKKEFSLHLKRQGIERL